MKHDRMLSSVGCCGDRDRVGCVLGAVWVAWMVGVAGTSTGGRALASEPDTGRVAGTFTETFDGYGRRWQRFTAATQWRVEQRPDGAAVRIDPSTSRAAIRSGLVRLPGPGASALACRYRGRRDGNRSEALVGVDVKVLLDDGSVIWFFPKALQLLPAERGRWVEGK